MENIKDIVKRVLIIEDDEGTIDNLKKEFDDVNIDITYCREYDKAENALRNNIPFDAVILDWYFVLDQSSDYSIKILKELKNRYFVPVFVYTGHLTDFENKSEDELGYPKNMILGFDKTIGVNELINKISEKLEKNLAYKLAVNYRNNICSHLEKVFFDLNTSESSSLGKVIKTIYGNGENIDWNNDIIITMLHRSLISDDDFTKKISEILRNVNDSGQNNPDLNRKLLSKILYHYGKSDYIRNGDIVIIRNSDNNVLAYGIVVTPDCDLENKSCRQVEIIELRILDDSDLNADTKKDIKSYKHPSLFYFPSVLINNETINFVGFMKQKILVRERDIADGTKFPSASKRLLYSQSFIFNGADVKLELICSKVNPYKAEFLQKLHSHNSRVGIPDIKKLL
jgi:hypothetical protein